MKVRDFKPASALYSLLRLMLVLGVLSFSYQLFGQEDSGVESNTTEATDSTLEETDEESSNLDSDDEESGSTDNDFQNSEEDSSVVPDSDAESDSTNEETTDDETEESNDSEFEDFIPSENISEDLEIPFPTDI